MNDRRYILASNKVKKIVCPYCGERGQWQRYIDTWTGEILPEHIGKCDNAIRCRAWVSPKSSGYAKMIYEQEHNGTRQAIKPPSPGTRYKRTFEAGSRQINGQIDVNQKEFTRISIYKKGNDPDGVLEYYTLDELATVLNQFKNVSGSKDKAPGVLKGIYKGGTAGQYCKNLSSFLPFDIDVKNTEDKKENVHLFDPEKNQTVFKALQKISVLAWRSNSKKGMAGYIYAPELAKVPNEKRDEHLEKSKAIYKHLEQIIYEQTGIKIQLDPGQGKFRQIRYIAEQDEAREINFTPLEFYTIEKKERIQARPDPVYFDQAALLQTLKGYNENTFLQNLLYSVPFPFIGKDVTEAIEIYRLGTIQTGTMAGAVTFPFIDRSGKINAVQVKTFDQGNHTIKTNYLHSILKHQYEAKNEPPPGWLAEYLKKENKVNCLFGEHLLKDHRGPVAIVEAPKTAIYCYLYFKEYEPFKNLRWLATGGLGYFTYARIKILRARTVLVFPDLSPDGRAFNQWMQKAKDYEAKLPGTKFIFSDLLERLAPDADRKAGNDIADVLIKMNWQEFRTPPTIAPQTNDLQPSTPETRPAIAPDDKVPPRPLKEAAGTETMEPRKFITAYVAASGELFVKNPIDPKRFTVYPDSKSYNERSAVPEPRNIKDVASDGLKPVQIDPGILKIIS